MTIEETLRPHLTEEGLLEYKKALAYKLIKNHQHAFLNKYDVEFHKKYLRLYLDTNTENTPSQIISRSSDWKNTPQGTSFWSGVYYDLRSYENKD